MKKSVKKALLVLLAFLILLPIGEILLASLFGYRLFKLFQWPGSVLVPGPEGVRAIAYGVQFGTYDYVRKASSMDKLPEYFKWVSNQPSNLVIGRDRDGNPPSGGFFVNSPAWWYDHDSGQVKIEVQRPELKDDPIGVKTQTLEYLKLEKINDNQVKIRKVVVYIVPVDFIIQVSSVPGAGIYTWKDVNVWFALDSVSWLNAFSTSAPPDPKPLTNSSTMLLSSDYKGAFPIIAWIGEYKNWVFRKDDGGMYSNPPDSNAVTFVQLTPDLSGRFIDLFTGPGSKYSLMLSSEVVTNEKLLAEALKPSNLPDPRMAQTVYFTITLNRFGPYVQDLGYHYWSYATWYPAVFYRVRVVYAIYGEHIYLWTTQQAEKVGYTNSTWQIRESTKGEEYIDPLTALSRSITAWFSNPWNVLQLWLFMFIILIIVLAITVPSVIKGIFKTAGKAAKSVAKKAKKPKR